jgi:hypothetical protein
MVWVSKNRLALVIAMSVVVNRSNVRLLACVERNTQQTALRLKPHSAIPQTNLWIGAEAIEIEPARMIAFFPLLGTE